MLERYEGINEIKEEIRKISEMVDEDESLPSKNEMMHNYKLAIFIKKIVLNLLGDRIHYRKCMIYHLLIMINSLKNDTTIYFYYSYRTYIENFIRVMLELNDDDKTGVNELFKNFSDRYDSNEELKNLVYYFKGEYGKACNYVHSNKDAEIEIHEFYSEILENGKNDIENKKNMILKMQKMLKKTVDFLIETKSNEIYEIYYRRGNQVEFFIGKQRLKRYKELLNL